MEQRSEAWWQIRCGKITGSRVGDLMRRNKPKKGQALGERSADYYRYLREKVAERITGKNRDRRVVASLNQRIDLEPDARAEYEFQYDADIQLIGFIEHPRIPDAGCSPDGLVLPNGGTEFKCLDAEQHLEFITNDVIDPDYVYQCHFNIACRDEAEWWDLCSFNPDMPEDAKLWRRRIERDDSMIATIDQAVIEFNEEVERKVEEVRAALRGSTPLEKALEGSLASLVH